MLTRRRSPRQVGLSKPPEEHSWTYVGSCAEEKNEKQTAVKGTMVEADHMIFSEKCEALGTRFTFMRVENGFAVGQIRCPVS